LAYGVGSGIDREAGAGLFTISMATKNATTGQALQLALAEAAKLARELTPPAELAARKNLLNGSFAVSVATPDGVLARLVPLCCWATARPT
jgi:predicted Zn-dependent peptidase